MGVHDLEFYPTIKELLRIPHSEPIFILRGQDTLALETLESYERMASRAGASPAFLHDLMKVRDEFKNFSYEHNSEMKVPD